MAVSFVRSTPPISVERFGEFKFIFDICRIFFVVCIVLSISNFIYSYRTSVEESDRKKLKWILFGLIIGPGSFIGLWVIPQTLSSRGLVNEEVILILMAVVPITFAISILKYHLMDINVILRRGTLYTLVIGFVMLFYTAILGITTLFIGNLTVTSSVMLSTAAAVIIALLFEPLKTRIKKFVDIKFFHVHYVYREAERKFTNEIKNCYDEKSLADFVVESVDELIPLNQIGFFQIDQTSKRSQVLSHKNMSDQSYWNINHDTLLASNKIPTARSEVIELEHVNFVEPQSNLFSKHRLTFGFPFLSEDFDLLGFLLLGEKKSGFRFTIEDIDLLNSISAHCGLALERIQLSKKLLTEKLESKRLHELNQLKSYFVSSVSHDLKTPLTSIRLFAEMLRESPNLSNKRRREYLNIIEGESNRLSRLVDNVLDFSKIERGIKDYNFKRLNLNKVVKQVLKTLVYQIQINGFNLITSIADRDLFINADGDAVEEAAINLISNSLKYAAERKEISISTYRKDDFAVLEVAD
ncbi:MAG: hypothetical protein FJZ11_07130, partial [Candidatus Omnitrophica bacterium]|nr:hypothetical protein [Candidatus Omnitrophota bacterium]